MKNKLFVQIALVGSPNVCLPQWHLIPSYAIKPTLQIKLQLFMIYFIIISLPGKINTHSQDNQIIESRCITLFRAGLCNLVLLVYKCTLFRQAYNCSVCQVYKQMYTSIQCTVHYKACEGAQQYIFTLCLDLLTKEPCGRGLYCLQQMGEKMHR